MALRWYSWSAMDGQRRRQVAALGVFALIALIALFPMRLAVSISDLADKGINARAIEGSIWYGTIRDLNAGPVPIGDVHARLHFLPLFLGRTELSVWREAGPATLPLDAVIGVRSGGFALKQANLDIATADAFSPLPLTRIRLDQFNAVMDDGACEQASGTVEVEFSPNLLGLTLQRGLSGKASCRNGALYLPLKGQSGLEDLEITVLADGSYTARLMLNGFGSDFAAPLAAAGFRNVGEDSLELQASGKF